MNRLELDAFRWLGGSAFGAEDDRAADVPPAPVPVVTPVPVLKRAELEALPMAA